MRAAARIAVVAMLATVLVPLDQPESWTTPVTLDEVLEGLPAADGDGGEVSLAGAPEGTSVVSLPVEAPLAFSAVGITAPTSTTAIAVRTSPDGAEWSTWEQMEFVEVEDGPDPDSAEGRSAIPGLHTEALWVAEARHLQVEVVGAHTEDLEVTLIDSMHLNDGPVEEHTEEGVGTPADASTLNIVPRNRWGADESLGGTPRTASRVHMGVIHHTAHTAGPSANTYTREEAPGLIRAMHRYHTERLGWSDLGYNVLVDRFGTVYEGRKGGLTSGVIGAHAAGFNTGSFGVSVIGNFVDEQAPAAAIRSVTEVVAMLSAAYGIDPTTTTTAMGNGDHRPTIVGHRDVGRTSCPGRIHDLLPQIRSEARVTAVQFPDVPSTSPHREPVLALAAAGVTQGCDDNLYCPRDTLTRGQAATFMLRAFELQPIPGSDFSDVRAGGVHAPAINALAARGWLQGYPDGTFRPHDHLTRGQLATLLSRTLGDDDLTATRDDGIQRLGDILDTRPSAAPYPDVDPASTHHAGIMALAEEGVRGDCNGRGSFCPIDDVLRDSTASFVYEVRKVHGLS